MLEGAVADAFLAAQAAAELAKFDDPANAPQPPVRQGTCVADLKVGDAVYRHGPQFGRVTKRAHEVDDPNGAAPPTCHEYVTIQWGFGTFARYTDETLEVYLIKKVPSAPVAPAAPAAP